MIKRKQSKTCIAAIKHKGKVYMAADRRVSWDFGQCQSMPHPKVLKRNELILAGTGDAALCTLIVKNMKFRPYSQFYEGHGFEDEYFNDIFYNDVIKGLKSKGFVDNNMGQPILKIPHTMGVEVLIALNHKLYSMEICNPVRGDLPNGLVEIDELNFPYATGCGGALSWGSLLTSEPLNWKPKGRLEIALRVAAQVSPGCDNVIDIVSE